MLKIAYLANLEEELPKKKTAKELRIERVLLMVKNERTKDRKKAEAFYGPEIEKLENELLKLDNDD